MHTNEQALRRPRTTWRALLASIAATICLMAALMTPASATGAVQVEGTAVPYPVAPATCNPGALGPVDYVLAMPAGSGSLVGCLYGVAEQTSVTQAGTVSRRTSETFVGCLGDRCGSFGLEAHITSKFEGPPPVGQVFGRCQHKIVAGTGTGDFEGVTGRLDFKDIIMRDANGNVTGVEFDYRGHLLG